MRRYWYLYFLSTSASTRVTSSCAALIAASSFFFFDAAFFFFLDDESRPELGAAYGAIASTPPRIRQQTVSVQPQCVQRLCVALSHAPLCVRCTFGECLLDASLRAESGRLLPLLPLDFLDAAACLLLAALAGLLALLLDLPRDEPLLGLGTDFGAIGSGDCTQTHTHTPSHTVKLVRDD